MEEIKGNRRPFDVKEFYTAHVMKRFVEVERNLANEDRNSNAWGMAVGALNAQPAYAQPFVGGFAFMGLMNAS